MSPLLHFRAVHAVLVVSLGAAGLAGCGPARPATVPVRGTVTFDGGPPPAEAMLYFVPLAGVGEGPRPRPGRALVDSAGNFSATSFDSGDGLMPGRYGVRIECWKVPPTMQTAGESYVPERFEPPELEVPERGSVRYDLAAPRSR